MCGEFGCGDIPGGKIETSFEAAEYLDSGGGPLLVHNPFHPFYHAPPQHPLLPSGSHPPSKVFYFVVEADDVRRVDLGLPRRIRVGEEGCQEWTSILNRLVRSLPLAMHRLVAIVPVTWRK